MANRNSAAKDRSLAMRLTALDIKALEEGALCDICQQPFLGPDLYEFPFATPCGHVFGNHCIMKWLAGGNDVKDCPSCRQSVLKLLTDKEGEQRALLEELDMHGPRDPIPDDPSTWDGRLAAVLTGKGRRWAVDAEALWKRFLRDLVVSLDKVTTAEEWLSGHAITVRRFLALISVESFYQISTRDGVLGPIGSRPVFGISDPATTLPPSYQVLCKHLDRSVEGSTVMGQGSQNVESHIFLTVDGDLLFFLAGCHRQLMARHTKLNEDLTADYRKAWP